MAARAYSGKKPKNLKHTLRVFLSYLGRHKKMLAVVAVLVTISAFRKGYRQRSFQNQNMYLILCRLLGIEPAPSGESSTSKVAFTSAP